MLIVCGHNNRPALYGSLDRRRKAPVKISRSSEEVGRMSNSRQSRFNRCDKEWSTDRLIRCWMLWGYDGDYDDVVVDGLRWKGILSMLFHWGIQRLTELDGIPRNWNSCPISVLVAKECRFPWRLPKQKMTENRRWGDWLINMIAICIREQIANWINWFASGSRQSLLYWHDMASDRSWSIGV